MSIAKKRKTIFGHRLTILMQEHNMNDTQLAELFGKERKYIITIRYSETGPRMNELIIMAKTFGVSIDYLAGLSNTRVPGGRNADPNAPKKFFDQRWED